MSEKTLKQNLADFETIINWFDGENIDVEKAISKYEQGVKLAEVIKKQLESEKNHIKVLNQKFDD